MSHRGSLLKAADKIKVGGEVSRVIGRSRVGSRQTPRIYPFEEKRTGQTAFLVVKFEAVSCWQALSSQLI